MIFQNQGTGIFSTAQWIPYQHVCGHNDFMTGFQTVFALLLLCEEFPPVTEEFSTQRELEYRALMFSSFIMTSSHGSFFSVTGHLWGEFTGHRWIPLTKGQKCRLWCFFDVGPHKLRDKLLNKQSINRWFETTWRQCGVVVMFAMGQKKLLKTQSSSDV